MTCARLVIVSFSVWVFLQTTIRELASVLDKEVVSSFFKQSMKKLLTVTKEANKSKNTKNSNLMQIDNSPDDGSLSAAR